MKIINHQKLNIMYTIQSGNTVITSGSEIMNPDGISSFTKQCVISTPFLFKNPPNIVVTVSVFKGPDDQYLGTVPFAAYMVKEFTSTGQTTFMVSASNVQDNTEVDYQYICYYYIMGELKGVEDTTLA
jgi:hypothetical protein